MKAIKFDRATGSLTAPKNWDEDKYGPCDPLPYMRDEEQNTITSVWMPSDEDRVILQSGGGIALTAFGTSHPPVMMQVVTVSQESADEMYLALREEVDGVIRDFKRFEIVEKGETRFYYTGYLFDDKKQRFADGEFFTTSLVVSGPDERGVIRTLNSLYILDDSPQEEPCL